MEVLFEELIIYQLAAIFLVATVIIYLHKQKRESGIVDKKLLTQQLKDCMIQFPCIRYLKLASV